MSGHFLVVTVGQGVAIGIQYVDPRDTIKHEIHSTASPIRVTGTKMSSQKLKNHYLKNIVDPKPNLQVPDNIPFPS